MKMVVAAVLGMLLAGGGVITGFFLALSIFQSNTSSPLPEYITISNVQYGVGSNGWIAVAVNNTGIASVTIVKVLVNNVKQSSVNPSLPIAVEPDNGLVLNVTMSVAEGETYQIDLFTSQGNMFSKSSQVPAGQQTGTILYKANVRFYEEGGTKKIDIDVGNSGTSDTQIIQVYIGTSSTNLENQTTSPSLPVSLTAGSIVRLTVTYSWNVGATYYFKVIPSAGQQPLGPFPEQAPG